MKKDILQGVKFALVGVTNTLVDIAIFTVLAQFLGVWVYFAHFVSYSCGTLNSYIFNRTWTFRTSEKFFSPQLLRFIGVNIIILVITTVIIWLAQDVLLMPTMVAKLASVVIGLGVNFLLNKILVFKS